jgi:NAD(P)-dependent dehydrogenase (short-subunit alcohol dehydrogenase family)
VPYPYAPSISFLPSLHGLSPRNILHPFSYNSAVLIYKPREAMDKDGELAAIIPMGRVGLVEEVAEAALFLAYNEYAHSCVLNIDGGLSAT